MAASTGTETPVTRGAEIHRAQPMISASLIERGRRRELTFRGHELSAARRERARNNIGIVLAQRGRLDEAVAHFPGRLCQTR